MSAHPRVIAIAVSAFSRVPSAERRIPSALGFDLNFEDHPSSYVTREPSTSPCAQPAAVEYAIEADPGQLTASFPLFDDLHQAERVAECGAFERDGLPAPRVLERRNGGPWVAIRP